MGMAMARGFWLVAVAASCFCICLKPPLWEAHPTHPSPSPMALNVHGIMCSALFLPLTPCRLSLYAFAYHRRMSRRHSWSCDVRAARFCPGCPGLEPRNWPYRSTSSPPFCCLFLVAGRWLLLTTIIQANCVLDGKCL